MIHYDTGYGVYIYCLVVEKHLDYFPCHTWHVILPIDFHSIIFQRGRRKTTNHGSWLISPDIRGGGCEALFIYPFTLLGQ